MTRGDIVTISERGDHGKPRPAIIVQSDWLLGTQTVLVCPMTSTDGDTHAVRLMIRPDPPTGLRRVSFAMTDKLIAVQRRKCGQVIGRMPDPEMVRLDELLSVVIGLAG